MKKDVLDTSAAAASRPAEVPFFARALGARVLDTNLLSQVNGGDSRKEKFRKTTGETKVKL
ncbi:hypothetical protein [Haliangium sp.]|uniref:hypothetical protein n=1 Tax=Haliangium sp. TaxID=2663208 RepID=UPI003D126EBF